jgi:hypothetical protein
MGKIKFKRQYAPVKFGDRPSGKTVEGKRIAALRAAESRRSAQMARESAELEKLEYSWTTRFWRWVGWGLSHMKFRNSPDRR